MLHGDMEIIDKSFVNCEKQDGLQLLCAVIDFLTISVVKFVCQEWAYVAQFYAASLWH